VSVHPRNVVLALVLAALLAANALLARPRSEAQAGGPLAPGFDPAAVERIELSAPGAEPLALERGDGGLWTVVQRGGFPAYAFAVDELFARVRALSRSDRVGEEAAAHDAQGVGASGTRLAFEDRDGRALLELVQGAPPGLAAGCNVRLAAEVDVYRAPGLPPVPVSPAAWLDTRLAVFEPAEVRALAARRQGQPWLELERDALGWGAPGPEGARAQRTRVERLLQVAAQLIFADVLALEAGPATGLDAPVTELVLELKDGERVTLALGGRADDGAYYATNSGWPRPWCVALPAETADVLLAALEDVAQGVKR